MMRVKRTLESLERRGGGGRVIIKSLINSVMDTYRGRGDDGI